MGIQVEFNPDLALRNYSEFEKGNRREEECIPKNLQEGHVYEFLKRGQRNYWLEGEIPLLETKGNQNLSSPLASIVILEATHLIIDQETHTKGKYKVISLDPKFEAYKRVE
jgi:hypothetical protein